MHAQRLPLDLRLPHRSLCYAQIKKASARHNALARWRVRLPIRTRDTYERTYLTLHEMSLTGRSPSMGWMDGPERRISAMKSIALEFSAEDPEIAEAFFRRALDVERERLASSEGLKSANVLRDIARVVNFSRMDVKRRSRILAAILTGIGQAGAFDASALDIVMMLARTDAEGALSMAWRMQEDFSQDEGEYALGYISMLREYLLRGANENASLGQPLPVRKARSLFLLGPLNPAGENPAHSWCKHGR